MIFTGLEFASVRNGALHQPVFFQFQDSVNTDDQYNVVHSNVYTASSQVYIAAGVGGPNLAGPGSNLSGYNVIAASVDTHAFQSTNGTLGTENYQQQTQILSAVDPRMTRRQSTTIGECSRSFGWKICFRNLLTSSTNFAIYVLRFSENIKIR